MNYRAAVHNVTREAVFRSRDELVTTYNRLRMPVERRRPLRLRLRPWRPVEPGEWAGTPAWCLLCGWRGEAFGGTAHSESATCPQCRSIARDRFLRLALVQRVRHDPAMRVLETSPRLGTGYRRAMGRSVRYLTSDFDLRAHRGKIALDLQDISLPDEHLGVVLCAHVLEHVPYPQVALAEMFRVLRPGGHLILQVPLLQPVTAPPAVPEFHGDDTPVFWRFGLDLTDRLRGHGFDTTLLVTEQLQCDVAARTATGVQEGSEVDAPALVAAADPADLTVLSDAALSAVSGFTPHYMFAVWHARKPATD